MTARLRAMWHELGSLLLIMVAVIVGGLLHASGDGRWGDVSWVVGALYGIGLSLSSIVRSLRAGRLGVDVIALLALAGAVLVREYLASVIISVMLATGLALEGWAAGRARRELRALMDRAPKSARRYVGGYLVLVPLEEVAPGDLLMVASGEVVPVDGVVLSESAVIDESALTGEALPVTHAQGESVRSGVINAGAPVDLRATTDAQDSTYAHIVRLVAEAESMQAPFVRLADRYALTFLFVTLAVSTGAWIGGGAARAVAVLVVATPCPLILAAPVAFVAGLSRAARRGIIVKSGAVLERLSKCTTVLLDKTGTVTVGRANLLEIEAVRPDATTEILTLAASLDQLSPHVLAATLVQAAIQRGCDLDLPTDVEEAAGLGIRGTVAGHAVKVGNAAWCGVEGTPVWARSARRQARLDGTLSVYVAIDGVPAGVLVFDDPLRVDAARTIRSLRSSGVKRIVMVTGDRAEVADTVGTVIGVDEVLAEHSPHEKLDAVRSETERAEVIMVGDGINDAPALALATVGVAMGARGATAASEAADVVLTVDRLDRLSEAITISRRTRRIATQSVVAGMSMSVVAMAFAAAGWLPAVAGAILQEGIDAAVIVNALRALRSGQGDVRLNRLDAELTRRFRDEHRAIRPDIEELAVVANSLGSHAVPDTLAQIRRVRRLLSEEIQPHEDAEEQVLYPMLGRFFEGSDPMGTMSRAHSEIGRQIRRVSQFIDDAGIDGLDDDDLVELRQMLYGLHAILKLHTAQEDESYLSLGDEVEGSGERATPH